MAKEKESVDRLTDIVVEEVSLVDRAANKRRFLLLKRDSEMAKVQEILQDEKGDLSAAPAADQTGDAVKDHLEKNNSISTTTKTEILQGLSTALEKMIGIVDAVKQIPEGNDDETDQLPAEIAEQLGGTIELLKNMGSKFVVQDQEQSEDKTEKSEQQAQESSDNKEVAKESDANDQLAQLVAKLSDVVSALTATKTAEKSEQPAQEPQPTVEDNQQKNTDETVSILDQHLAKALAGVNTTVGQLASIVKSQQEALDKLGDQVAPSNSLPVEKSEQEIEIEDVSWPLDLNRPINPTTVQKSRWFE